MWPYNSHIYRYHRVALGLNKGVYDLVVCPEVGSDDSGPNVSVYEEDPIAEIDPPSSCATLSLPSPTQAAKFLLQLREGYGVSQVAMISIIDSCNKMCMQAVSNAKLEIKDRLIQAGIHTDVILCLILLRE